MSLKHAYFITVHGPHANGFVSRTGPNSVSHSPNCIDHAKMSFPSSYHCEILCKKLEERKKEKREGRGRKGKYLGVHDPDGLISAHPYCIIIGCKQTANHCGSLALEHFLQFEFL